MYNVLITEYFNARLDQIIVLNSLYAFSFKILILQFRRKQSKSVADKEERNEHSDRPTDYPAAWPLHT